VAKDVPAIKGENKRKNEQTKEEVSLISIERKKKTSLPFAIGLKHTHTTYPQGVAAGSLSVSMQILHSSWPPLAAPFSRVLSMGQALFGALDVLPFFFFLF
jgi:hypothetical protein